MRDTDSRNRTAKVVGSALVGPGHLITSEHPIDHQDAESLIRTQEVVARHDKSACTCITDCYLRTEVLFALDIPKWKEKRPSSTVTSVLCPTVSS